MSSESLSCDWDPTGRCAPPAGGHEDEALAGGAHLGRDDERTFERLVDAFRAGSVIAFVGAGCSMRAGYPGWDGLLARMEQALIGGPGESVSGHGPGQAMVSRVRTIPDLQWRAGQYRRALGEGRYHQLMRELFGPDGHVCHGFHHDLVALPFRHVITTNYDDLLDRAHLDVFGALPDRVEWDDAAQVQELLAELDETGVPRRHVYLHGRFDNPATLVLTERDYQARYMKGQDSTDAKLAALFDLHILFVGYSLSDMDVMSLFRRLKVQLGYELPRHFALMPFDPDKDDAWALRTYLDDKYGVAPVFYPLTPDHAGLHALIGRLAAALA